MFVDVIVGVGVLVDVIVGVGVFVGVVVGVGVGVGVIKQNIFCRILSQGKPSGQA